MDDGTDEPRSLAEWLAVHAADELGPVVDPADVTAVLVVHDAEDWLPRTLGSLAELDPCPGRVVAVDCGSTDASPELLHAALDRGALDEIVGCAADVPFADAIAAGLGGTRPGWIWLLHDDSRPHSDALEHLLEGVRRTDASVVFPKLLRPRRRNYPPMLAEVGQSITASGRRIGTVEDGDIDQRQDVPATVMGGSTAGMLIRGAAYRDLGGLAPEVPRHRDGVEFAWRARDAGHVVTTWPDAAVVHRRAGRMGERDGGAAAHQSDRLAALRVVAARGPKPTSSAALVGLSALRAAGFLLAKSPSTAAAELRAAREFRSTPDATASLRARGIAPAADVTALRPRRAELVRHTVDRAGVGFTERLRDLAGDQPDTSLDELTGDDYAAPVSRGRRLPSVLFMVVVGLLLAGLVASRMLLGGPSGGGLFPAPSWSALFDAWSAPADGVAGGSAPWLGLAWWASLLTLGHPGWLIWLTLVTAPAVAALTADRFLRGSGVAGRPAAALAAVWGTSTLAFGMVTGGDPSGLVIAVTLPLLAHSVRRILQGDEESSRWRSPAMGALWLTVAASAWPLLLVGATLCLALVAWRRRRLLAEFAVLVTPAWLFMAPWLPTLVRWPGRFLAGIDPLARPTTSPAGIALLLGRLVPSGLPLWLSAGFVAVIAVLAVLGLASLPNRRAALNVMAGLAGALVAGVLVSRVTIPVDGGRVRPLLAGWALLALAALLILAARAATSTINPRRFRRTVVALLLATSAVVAGTWAWLGFAGPVSVGRSELPAFATDAMREPRSARVLMLERGDDGVVTWNLVADQSPVWGSGERALADGFASEAADVVEEIAGGAPTSALSEGLMALGVSHVWARGLDTDTVLALDDAGGLTPATLDDGSVVWTVTARPGLVSIVDGSTTTSVPDGTVEAATSPRTLMLAEPASRAWDVRVGGQRLERADSATSFTLPAGLEGDVVVAPARQWAVVVWQSLVLLVTAWLTLPGMRSAVVPRRAE